MQIISIIFIFNELLSDFNKPKPNAAESQNIR